MNNLNNDVNTKNIKITRGDFNFKGELFFSLCPIFIIDKKDTYHEGIVYGANINKKKIASSIFLSTRQGLLEFKDEDVRLIVKTK